MSTQSGALGLAILDYARQLNIGISSFVSVGNKADVSGNDLLQHWEHDPRTAVILLYLESFGNPAKFSRIGAPHQPEQADRGVEIRPFSRRRARGGIAHRRARLVG